MGGGGGGGGGEERAPKYRGVGTGGQRGPWSRPVGWGGSVGSVEPPRPSKLVPLALVPPAQLGPACRSWFRFFPLLSAYHELFFANELINYFTCMTLYK